MSREQQQQLGMWEAVICSEAPAGQSRLQPEVDVFCEWLAERHEELRAFAQPSLKALGDMRAAKSNKS